MKKIFIILLLFISLIASGTNYYIKTGGNDSYTGLSDVQAWLTIGQVNTVWAAGTFAAGDSILFNRGDTFYGSFAVDESGAAGNHIIVGAYGTGADPIITGLTTVDTWTDYGAGTIYYKVIAIEAALDLEMVIFDGDQVAMGRYPDLGSWNNYDSYSGNTSITDAALIGQPNFSGGELFFIKNEGLPAINAITTHTDALVQYTAMYNYGNMSDKRYFIQEHFNTLTAYKEWYYDGDTLFMYFGAENPALHTVQVATIDHLVEYTAARHYHTWDNLDFYGANRSVFYCTTNNYQYIQNCTLRYSGVRGVWFSGSDYGKVDNCDISYCNDLGIHSTSGAYNTEITNNNIHNIGSIFGAGSYNYQNGLTCNQGADQVIRYNNIHNIGRQGMFIAGDNFTVQYNLIDTFCVNLRDGGGIYIGSAYYSGDPPVLIEPNSGTIDNNIILNGIGGSNLNEAFGIYVDINNVWGITVTDNTAAYCSGAGIKLSNVTDIECHDNKFYDNAVGLKIQDGATVGDEVPTLLDDLNITRNQYVAKAGQSIYWTRSNYDRYDEWGVIDSSYCVRPSDDPTGETVSLMDYINYPVRDEMTFAAWKTYSGLDTHSKTWDWAGDPAYTDSIYFHYNATSSDSLIVLDEMNMEDLNGTNYHYNVTLGAYESVILFISPLDEGTRFLKSTDGTTFLKYGTKFMKIE